MPILLAHDDGPFLQDDGARRHHERQSFEHMRRPSVVEMKEDHALCPATRERRDLAEVEIKSKGLVTLIAKRDGNTDIHPHLQKESHAPLPVWPDDIYAPRATGPSTQERVRSS